MTAPEQRAPKQDRSRITRERLLGASIDLLATQGWAATTVGAVAAAASVLALAILPSAASFLPKLRLAPPVSVH